MDQTKLQVICGRGENNFMENDVSIFFLNIGHTQIGQKACALS